MIARGTLQVLPDPEDINPWSRWMQHDPSVSWICSIAVLRDSRYPSSHEGVHITRRPSAVEQAFYVSLLSKGGPLVQRATHFHQVNERHEGNDIHSGVHCAALPYISSYVGWLFP